jgi:hypothetical protein
MIRFKVSIEDALGRRLLVDDLDELTAINLLWSCRAQGLQCGKISYLPGKP